MARFSDLRPYVWYDISLYPSTQRYHNGPVVDAMVKLYNPATDKFYYYKRRSVYLLSADNREDEAAVWHNVPAHDRVIAFMHDGSDLPENSAEGLPAHPPICLISETERKIRKDRAMTSLRYTVDTTGTVLWTDPNNLRLPAPKVGEILQDPETKLWYNVVGVRTLDEGLEILISPDTSGEKDHSQSGTITKLVDNRSRAVLGYIHQRESDAVEGSITHEGKTYNIVGHSTLNVPWILFVREADEPDTTTEME